MDLFLAVLCSWGAAGLAELGVLRAVLVIVGFVVANLRAENILSPALMSRGLNPVPTTGVCFLRLLGVGCWGGRERFLGMPIYPAAVGLLLEQLSLKGAG